MKSPEQVGGTSLGVLDTPSVLLQASPQAIGEGLVGRIPDLGSSSGFAEQHELFWLAYKTRSWQASPCSQA